MQSERIHTVGLVCARFLAVYAILYAAILLYFLGSIFDTQFTKHSLFPTKMSLILPLFLFALATTPFVQIRFLQRSTPRGRIGTLLNIAVAAAPMLVFLYHAVNLATSFAVAHRAGTINFWLALTIWTPAVLATLSFGAVLSLGIQDLKTARGEPMNA